MLANAYFCRALICEKNGEFEQAVDDFKAAIDCSDQKHAEAFFRLARVREKQGLERTPDQGPQDPGPLDDFDAAIELVQDVPERASCFRRYCLHRGNFNVVNKRYEDGIDDFTAVMGAGKRPDLTSSDDTIGIDACMARGQARLELAAFKDKNEADLLDKAIHDFTNVIRANSRCSLAFKSRADAYRALRDDTQAKQDYERSIVLKSDGSRAFFKRALDRGGAQPQEAIADLSEAIRRDRNFTDAYYNRGLLWQTMAAELENAVQDFLDVLKREPGHVYARFQLGRVYGMLAETFASRTEQSREYRNKEIEAYSTLIKQGNDLYFVRKARETAYLELGKNRWHSAKKDSRKAKQLKPDLLP